MEVLYVVIGILLGVAVYWFGQHEGKKLREIRTVERVSDGVKIVSQSEIETIQPEPQPKPEKPNPDEIPLDQQRKNWESYKG